MAQGSIKIGVLTGGGDCPGLNAVIRAVVKTCLYSDSGRRISVVGIRDGFLGLIQGRAEPLTDRAVSGILPRGGTILGSSNRDNPFDFDGEIDGQPVRGDVGDRVLANVDEMGLDGLVVIGGDGTLSIAHRLSGMGVPVVGVPKTIDNDIAATDQTFGFDSALSIATEAVDRLHTTAESHHRVMVLEVMGRYAGWIALHAGVAGGGDVILIPEIPFSMGKVIEKIEDRCARGKTFSIVVVAEGAHETGRDPVFYRTVEKGFEKRRLGGISRVVGDAIEEATGLESRVTILGHVQRGGSPTAFDRILGTNLGVYAAKMILDGQAGTMAALQGTRIVGVPLEDAISHAKRVDPGCQLVEAARAVGTAFGD
ncbi:6-phosphofructokinase [Myxococcota bacterium]|nr:6-phosphofructokinase [Myxococcota bacterium]